MTHPTINQTIQFMMHAHRGQLDKSGASYWLHPYRVMLRLARVNSAVASYAALLHDVVEDTDYGISDLAERGYSPAVLDAVDIVSRYKDGRDKERTYVEWIKWIRDSRNMDAILVKYADLLDNNAPARLANLPPQHHGLEARHTGAMAILTPVIHVDLLCVITTGDINVDVEASRVTVET